MILGMITFFVLLLLGLQLWSPLNDFPPPPAMDAVSTTPSPEPGPAAAARDTIAKSTPSTGPLPPSPPKRMAPTATADPFSHPAAPQPLAPLAQPFSPLGLPWPALATVPTGPQSDPFVGFSDELRRLVYGRR